MSLLHNQVNTSMHYLSDCTCFLLPIPTIRYVDSLLRFQPPFMSQCLWLLLSCIITVYFVWLHMHTGGELQYIDDLPYDPPCYDDPRPGEPTHPLHEWLYMTPPVYPSHPIFRLTAQLPPTFSAPGFLTPSLKHHHCVLYLNAYAHGRRVAVH